MILLLCALFVVGVGIVLLVRGTVPSAPTTIFSPLWKGSTMVANTLSGMTGYFKDKKAILDENRRLKEALMVAELAALDRNQLFEENLDLKEHLGRTGQPNAALASVLVKPPHTPYDTLIIDIGKNANVSVGDRVAAHGALLIGKVTEVYERTSRVTLFSAPSERYDGFLRGSIPVSIEGIGGGSLRMLVPYDAQAVEGDAVSIPGIESNTAAIIEHVESGQGDSASTAYLRLPVSPFSIRTVDVWRGNIVE